MGSVIKYVKKQGEEAVDKVGSVGEDLWDVAKGIPKTFTHDTEDTTFKSTGGGAANSIPVAEERQGPAAIPSIGQRFERNRQQRSSGFSPGESLYPTGGLRRIGQEMLPEEEEEKQAGIASRMRQVTNSINFG